MHDLIQAAIYDGIKRSTKLCIDNECIAAAVTLIYAGIDTMAFFGMPDTQIVSRTVIMLRGAIAI